MSIFKKPVNARHEHKHIYIFTEGTKTEVNYFNSKKEEIRLSPNIEIIVNGLGESTINLVNCALNYIFIKKVNLKYDECWLVFDKDDFKDFDEAIKTAEKNNLKVAYSNRCFEVWLLLHFDYLNSSLSRKDYESKLTKHLIKITGNRNIKYEKTFSMYDLIKNFEDKAIVRAEKILNGFSPDTLHSKKDPSTKVHLLVDSLNKLRDSRWRY